jgi:tellurite resistance protein
MAGGSVGRLVENDTQLDGPFIMTELDYEEFRDLDYHDALVGVMILASMSDGVVKLSELITIQRVIDHFPIFAAYDELNTKEVFFLMEALLEDPSGIDRFLAFLKETLPPFLHETAYAVACDVVAADGKLDQSELRFLQEMEDILALDPLYVAAIERSTRALYVQL